MASSFGIAVTNLTSKFGVLSRKACIRLATETGEKTLAKKLELGRNPNKEEIEQIFAEILPKACRPKIITKDSEVYESLRKSGFTDEQIAAQLQNVEKNAMAAANVSNGTKKYTYWVPYERHEKISEPTIKQYIETTFPAFIGHEMEHSLEKNCRVIDILRRKTSKIRAAIFKFFDKNYTDKLSNRLMAVHDYEGQLQIAIAKTLKIDETTGNIIAKCKATVKDISDLLKNETGVSMEENLQKLIRENYASAGHKGSENDKRFRLLRYWLDMERPAYEVTGQLERKILGLKDGEYSPNEVIAKGYEASIDIAKQERRTYWKNKLFGRLKKPNIYVTDKDILKHAVNKEEEEQILTDIIKDMSVEQKQRFIKVLSSLEGQPNAINSLSQFLNATTVDGKSIWRHSLHKLEGINTELLSNPDFLKIAKITNKDGLPVYEYVIKDIAATKPENIKKFAEIADKNYIEELNVNGMNIKKQNYIYEYMVSFLDNPNFNELKSFCEIKVDGKTPYCDLLYGLSKLLPERIKANLELAQQSAKEGKSVFQEICQEIEQFLAKA